MLRLGRRSTIFVLLAGSALLSLNSQAQQRGLETFRVQHFTAADGLPSNDVFAVAEDSLGFLWFGTANGLVRYDGYEFRNHLPQPGDTTSIGGRCIIALHVDPAGDVWAGHGYQDPRGLSRFDPATERFRRYRHEPGEANSLIHDEVTSIATSPNDPSALWIGTRDWPGQSSALSRLDAATGTFRHFTTEDGLSSSNIWELYVDRAGTLWVGTEKGGLNRFEATTDSFTTFFSQAVQDPRNWLTAIHEDRSGVLWTGTSKGLSRFDPATATFTSFLPDDPVQAILEDQTGTLWVGTARGLFTFDRSTDRLTRLADQPAGLDIWSLYEDRFGVLWVAAYGGLLKVERRLNPFKVYRDVVSRPSTIEKDWIGPITIFEDSRGVLWIGSAGTLKRLDRADGTVTHIPNEAGIAYEDRAGRMWVSAWEHGLQLMDRDTGAFTLFEHDPDDPSSIGQGYVNPLLEDEAGNFWIALFLGGIDRMDRERGTFTHYTHASHGLGDDRVLRLYEAPSKPGILWAGTEAGLSRLDIETERFDNFHSEVLRRSMMMVEDREGRFWVATASSGLHLFDRELGAVERTFTTEDGLAHNVVWSLYEDEQGFLWMGTENGLSKFNPRTETFRNYFERDGLPGNIFREHAHHQSSSGELFFAGPSGPVSFFPEELVHSTVPPEVVLTDLRIRGRTVEIGPDGPLERSISVTNRVTLAYAANDVSFAFVGLHFVDPPQHRYRYVLEGFEEDWVDAGAQRTVRYANLDPGEYVFRITAQNGDGAWNPEGASVRLTILPPWWRTWWAYGLSVLLFFVVAFTVDRVQRRRVLRKERERSLARELQQAHRIESLNVQLRAHQQQLESQNAVLEEQKRHLLQLSDLKSRFFANISHELRTPLTLVLGPLDDAFRESDDVLHIPRLRGEAMRRSVVRLIRLINQLLDLSRLEDGAVRFHPQPGDLVAFLRRITLAFASQAEQAEVTLRFHADAERIPACFDRDHVEKIIYNLLSNAFKFTASGGKIRLTVCRVTSDGTPGIEICVRDTGCGIPESELPHVFDRFYQVDDSATRAHDGTGIGLALAKELVDLHDGAISVESEIGFGTTFRVWLPDSSPHVPNEITDEEFRFPRWIDDHEVEEEEQADDLTERRRGCPTVLIVEDNVDVRAYLRDRLSVRYRIGEARDGREGLEMVQSERPDLVLADVMMPRMDGYELCYRIKHDESLRHIPVVLLTARADEADKMEGLQRGADAYLVKPFNAEELLVRVENLIELRRVLRQQFSDEVLITPTEIVVSSEDATFLEQVRDVVEKHMGESRFGVEMLAEEVALSRRQLQRKLQALTDLSPSGYIRMMRLERAAQLLRQQAGRISEVAHAVGFGSAEHFSRVFRQVFGETPSAFQENAARQADTSDEESTDPGMHKSSRR